MTEEVKLTPDEAEKGIRLRFWEVIKEIDRSEEGKYRVNLKASKELVLGSMQSEDGTIDPGKYDELLNDDYSHDSFENFSAAQDYVAELSLGESVKEAWKTMQINQLLLEEGFDGLSGADKTDLRKNKMEDFLEEIVGLQEVFLLKVVELEDKKAEGNNG